VVESPGCLLKSKPEIDKRLVNSSPSEVAGVGFSVYSSFAWGLGGVWFCGLGVMGLLCVLFTRARLVGLK
jgi:hypothetical protein